VFYAYNTGNRGSIHHVGMYIGGGAMIEAPYSGASVRISSIDRRDYIGAVRPTG
jgi:peptidoglycan DL-endopeptidase RipA